MDRLMINLHKVRYPATDQSIFHSQECLYSFDTPESPGGVYINLTTYLCFNEEYALLYALKTDDLVFLHMRRELKPKKSSHAQATEREFPSARATPAELMARAARHAVGMAQGERTELGQDQYEYNSYYSIVVMPDKDLKLPYPHAEFPLIILEIIDTLLENFNKDLPATDKLMHQLPPEELEVSFHSTHLEQLDNGVTIPPKDWKCEQCDMRHNLWLNLTDGAILCGRRYYDGSGGNDHALEHYKRTGYPLAVKLGTINGVGAADVFCYPEDKLVADPLLQQHLLHFGIHMEKLQKSDVSMQELEMDYDQLVAEWMLLTEGNNKLEPIYGAGYTGMQNLGNTCYINSVMQVLFKVDDFMERFTGAAARSTFNRFPADPKSDFVTQMCKLGVGLWSGNYSNMRIDGVQGRYSPGVNPWMFREVLANQHPDLKTTQQQDAHDFYLFLVNILQRNFNNRSNPMNALAFTTESRYECLSSKQVKYTRQVDYCLPLEIPIECATNQEEFLAAKKVEEESVFEKPPKLRLNVPFEACLKKFFEPELIDPFYSTATNAQGQAHKTTRLATMPDYLMIHMRKFGLTEDWTPMKLDVTVEMPEYLDINEYRGTGLQEHEQLLPEAKEAKEAKQEAIKQKTEPEFDRVDVDLLKAMGFSERHALAALRATDGDIDRATDWVFSHSDVEEDGEVAEPQLGERDGTGRYILKAFISHMGESAHTGHYVAHVRCHDRIDGWVIFNDEKVSLVQNPPIELGYMYLYERVHRTSP